MQGTTLGCKPDLITGDRSPQTRCPLGTGLKTDVPIDEIGDMFGYDGHLPLSKVKMLFVTGSYPVVQRELIRVGVDIDVTPVMSTWPNKPVAIRVRMGSIVCQGSIEFPDQHIFSPSNHRGSPALIKV